MPVLINYVLSTVMIRPKLVDRLVNSISEPSIELLEFNFINKYSDTFWLADRVRLFIHYIISLSSLCKLIWGHWTYEMPVIYILSSVWVRLSIFSQLSILQYMGLCVFGLPISLVMIERIYTFYHHQIGSMNYYLLFRVRSWNNGMRCMSPYSYGLPLIQSPIKKHMSS